MVYHIEGDHITPLESGSFEALDFREADIEKWIINTPSILNEGLIIVSSQYAKFDKTDERPDVLALDPEGRLVVIELKRDRADSTTDLQAIKYASYCSTITAEELQQDYRTYWNEKRDEEAKLTPEDVGIRFCEFLDQELSTSDDGYAEFALDDRPRIMLVAGGFGPEITTPVVWLEREYEMDITCIELDVYQQGDEQFVSSRQVLPIPEAEEYMAKRRKKERQQSKTTDRRKRTITALLDEGAIEEGDLVVFNSESVPSEVNPSYDPEDEFWQGRITGKTGRSDNIEWLSDGEEYSASGLAEQILQEVAGEDIHSNGYPDWIHEETGETLVNLRRKQVGDVPW